MAGEPEPVGAGCFWLLTNSQEPEPEPEPEPVLFWPLGDGAARENKKAGAVAGAGAAWEKNQETEPELLEKKVRSRRR